MEFSALLSKMFVFIVLMLIGYYLARRKVIGPEFTRTASKLTVDVFLIGTILGAMLSAGDGIRVDGLPKILMLTTLIQVIGFAVSALTMHFVKVDPNRSGACEVLMAVPNSVFIALPIASSLYGNYAVFIISVSCIPFNVLLYSYGAWRVKRGGKEQIRIREIFTVPLITTLVGIVILLLEIPVPQPVRDLLSALGGATMPLSMLVIGASIGSVSLLDAFRNRDLALLSVFKLLVIPVICWFACRLYTDDSVLLMTCMITAAAPSAVVASILAIQSGQDPVFSSEAVQHSTICSVVTIPLLIRIFSMLV